MIIRNFGGVCGVQIHPLAACTAPNAGGKTTILNAFLWSLTGKVCTGFVPRNTAAPEGEPTEVVIEGEIPALAAFSLLRRTAAPTGTTLYIGGSVQTQAAFAASFEAATGAPLDLLAACCDTNVLTSDALTSDELRKLLTRSGALDGGEIQALRKTLDSLRKQVKTAEQYALTNVTIPARTIPELNVSEQELLRTYNVAAGLLQRPAPSGTCETCGAPLDPQKVGQAVHDRNVATETVKRFGNEAARLLQQRNEYDAETQRIGDAQRLIDAATAARKDVIRLTADIAGVQEQIRAANETTIRAELPAGVEIQSTDRNGVTLVVDGVPLKSVNHARRVEIAVRLLHAARERYGVVDAFPIWIDNAESVQGLDDIPNVIRLTVG